MIKLAKTCFIAAVAAGATLPAIAEDVRVPNRMPLIHSHNDYAQERPFWGAYEAGADSIEADVYLVDGDLLVAHTRKELKKENTLRRTSACRSSANARAPTPAGARAR